MKTYRPNKIREAMVIGVVALVVIALCDIAYAAFLVSQGVTIP